MAKACAVDNSANASTADPDRGEAEEQAGGGMGEEHERDIDDGSEGRSSLTVAGEPVRGHRP